MAHSYEVVMECSNCRYKWRIKVPKGKTKPKDLKCPKCECDTGE